MGSMIAGLEITQDVRFRRLTTAPDRMKRIHQKANKLWQAAGESSIVTNSHFSQAEAEEMALRPIGTTNVVCAQSNGNAEPNRFNIEYEYRWVSTDELCSNCGGSKAFVPELRVVKVAEVIDGQEVLAPADFWGKVYDAIFKNQFKSGAAWCRRDGCQELLQTTDLMAYEF